MSIEQNTIYQYFTPQTVSKHEVYRPTSKTQNNVLRCSLFEFWLGVVQTNLLFRVSVVNFRRGFWLNRERVNWWLPGGGWRAKLKDCVGAPPGSPRVTAQPPHSAARGVDTVTDRACCVGPKHDALTHGSLLIHCCGIVGFHWKTNRLHGIAYQANRPTLNE